MRFTAYISFRFLVLLAGLISATTLPAFAPVALSPAPIPNSLYEQMDFGDAPAPEESLFNMTMAGVEKITHLESSNGVLAIIDFRLSANEKRLWVLDMHHQRLLYHTWVAHGRNSGEEYARTFSNTVNSYQSSLGFYRTGSTYQGKHGLSLKLHGMEPGINDKAEERAIVIHGAEYVSEKFIKQAGRLGRSHGCPAVPMDLHKPLITTLAGGAIMFIYHPTEQYRNQSALIPSTLWGE
jgi:hypothetical protein